MNDKAVKELPGYLDDCPFCGGKVFMHTGHNNISFITCGQNDNGASGCGAIVSFMYDQGKDTARKCWNRRTGSQA